MTFLGGWFFPLVVLSGLVHWGTYAGMGLLADHWPVNKSVAPIEFELFEDSTNVHALHHDGAKKAHKQPRASESPTTPSVRKNLNETPETKESKGLERPFTTVAVVRLTDEMAIENAPSGSPGSIEQPLNSYLHLVHQQIRERFRAMIWRVDEDRYFHVFLSISPDGHIRSAEFQGVFQTEIRERLETALVREMRLPKFPPELQRTELRVQLPIAISQQ